MYSWFLLLVALSNLSNGTKTHNFEIFGSYSPTNIFSSGQPDEKAGPNNSQSSIILLHVPASSRQGIQQAILSPRIMCPEIGLVFFRFERNLSPSK